MKYLVYKVSTTSVALFPSLNDRNAGTNGTIETKHKIILMGVEGIIEGKQIRCTTGRTSRKWGYWDTDWGIPTAGTVIEDDQLLSFAALKKSLA